MGSTSRRRAAKASASVEAPIDPMPLHAGSGEDVHIDACGAGVFEQRRLADTGVASEHKRTFATGAGVRQ